MPVLGHFQWRHAHFRSFPTMCHPLSVGLTPQYKYYVPTTRYRTLHNTLKMSLHLQSQIYIFCYKISYNYVAKFMGLGPRGGVIANIKNLKFTVDMETDLLTYQTTLKKFKINKLG